MAISNQFGNHIQDVIGGRDRLAEFCERYGIHDIRMETNRYGDFYNSYSGYGYNREMVELKLSKDALDGLVNMDRCAERLEEMYKRTRDEYKIRARSPAVQKAWEEYQLLLKLAE